MSLTNYSDVQLEKKSANRRNKERNAEKTLASILSVSEDLFAVYGFEGTSIRMITESIDMTQPNFYNYFSSKEVLYASVLTKALSPLADLVGAGVAESFSGKLTLKQRDEIAKRVIDEFLNHLIKNKNIPGLLYQESIRGGVALESISNGLFKELVGTAANGLEVDLKNSVWPPELFPQLINAWFNMILGYFISSNLFQKITPGNAKPLSKRGLENQRQFLMLAWDRLMRP